VIPDLYSNPTIHGSRCTLYARIVRPYQHLDAVQEAAFHIPLSMNLEAAAFTLMLIAALFT